MESQHLVIPSTGYRALLRLLIYNREERGLSQKQLADLTPTRSLLTKPGK